MKPFGAGVKATAPYVLSVTKTALQTVQSVNSLLHAPCVAPVIGVALQVITIVEAIKSNKDECAALNERIAQLTIVTAKPWEGKTDADVPTDTKTAIKSLRESMEVIQTDLEPYAKAGRLKRILLSADLTVKIKAASAKLDYAMQLFQVDAAILGGIKDDTILGEVRQLAIDVKEGPLDTPIALPTSTLLPPRPEVFVGRDVAVDDLVKDLVSVENARLPVLGTGGIGKTSLILAVLNDPRVVEAFRENRHWIPCVEAASVSLLIELLAVSLGAPNRSADRLSDIMSFLRGSKDRRVIAFDNFETPWELDANQHTDVENLLRSVASVGSLSIVITMRASQPPFCLRWTKTSTSILPPLAKDDAHRLFLEFSLNTASEDALDRLLKALDYVPLAVTLMANLSLYGETPQELLHRWNDKKEGTSVLDLGPGRLNSLDISIKVSIDSPVMKRRPEALALLQVLAMLPGGARRDFLPSLVPSLRVQSALIPLFQTALASTNATSWTVQVLTPIRAYVLRYHPLEPLPRATMHNAYFEMLLRISSEPKNLAWKGNFEIFLAEESNLDTVLLDSLKAEQVDQNLAMRACYVYAIFQYFSKHRIDVIEAAVRYARKWSSPSLAKSLQVLGDIHYLRGQFGNAESILEEALVAFKDVGDSLGAAQCLSSLGDILYMRDQYVEAESVLTEARRAFEEIGSRLGATQCLQSLGEILYMRDQYVKAESVFTEARQAFEEIGSNLGVAQCLKSLSQILHMWGQYTEAISSITEARQAFEDLGNGLGAAQCLRILGDILHAEGKYGEAEVALTSAMDVFVGIGSRFDAALCLTSLADIMCAGAQYDKAESTLEKSRTVFEELGDRQGIGYCLLSLGDILNKRGRYDEAKLALRDARKMLLEIGDCHGTALCLQSYGDVLYTREHYSESEVALEEALQLFSDIGYKRGAAQCLRSLGNIMQVQYRTDEAESALRSARDAFLGMGLIGEAEKCQESLDQFSRV